MSLRGDQNGALRELMDRVPGGRVPALVWLAAALLSALLLVHREASTEYPALARALDYEVSASEAGRLAGVSVDLYDTVAAGDVVATLDDSSVAAALESAAAELRALDAELAHATALARAGGSQAQLASQGDLRRFEIDVEDRRLEELALSVAIETDRIEQQRLRRRLDRVRPLYAQGIVSPEEYDEVRLSEAALHKRIAENMVAIATTREKLGAAEERRRAYLESSGVVTEEAHSVLAPLQARLDAQAHLVAGFKAEREALVLRAPVAGRVRVVLARSGQSIVAGEAVVVITPRFTTEVIAFAPEQDGANVGEQDHATVMAGGWPRRTARSVVTRVSPAVEPLPERLWGNANRPEYGVAFVVTLAEPLDIRPGERVRVRLVRAS